MDTSTFAWAIAATILSGIQLFYQKVAAVQKRDSALNGMIMYGSSSVAALGASLFYFGLPLAWESVALIAAVSGGMHAVGNYMRIEALKYIDSVIYFPLNKVLGPIVVVIGGVWWFADPLTAKEYMGIALSLMVPVLLISAAEKHRQSDLALGMWLLVGSTVFTSVSMLVTKSGVDLDPTIFFMMGMSQVAGMLSSAGMYLRSGNPHATPLSKITRADIQLGLISGALGFVSFYALLHAFSTGFVSLVYVIHAHYILVPIVLSVWWYGEHIDVRKVVAIFVSFLAISLLV